MLLDIISIIAAILGLTGFFLQNSTCIIISLIIYIAVTLIGLLSGALKTIKADFLCIIVGLFISSLLKRPLLDSIVLSLCSFDLILYIASAIGAIIHHSRLTPVQRAIKRLAKNTPEPKLNYSFSSPTELDKQIEKLKSQFTLSDSELDEIMDCYPLTPEEAEIQREITKDI